ncbi:MAG: Lacal_2735 family protein [Cyclobacteriaceae bacterium]
MSESALQKKYEKLMAEAHKLMSKDRKKGDAKIAEAELVMDELVKLKQK